MFSDQQLLRAKNQMANQGVTVTEWAMQMGFRPSTVHSVLAGRSTGRWGEAHEVCVALALKKQFRVKKLALEEK